MSLTLPWRPHTERPTGPETALIAVHPNNPDIDDVEVRLMTELHIYDLSENCWMSERGGMPLRYAVFLWVPETEVLRSVSQ